jgi:cytochrome P450
MIDEIIDGHKPKIDNLLGNLIGLYDMDDMVKKLKTFDALSTSIFFNIEKTSFIVSCCLFELSKNQEIQMKLRKEIQNQTNIDLNFFNDQKNYLTMVIKETMRMYSPSIAFGRNTKKDIQLQDFNIPKNVNHGDH